ncbi:MAG: MFS transporter [Anaerolineae bacterium]|nr:MFS transporter [Anaerolineae bacterium]
MRDLGAGDVQVGFAFTLMTASYAATQFLGGIVSDRFGRKMAIVIPTFLYIPLYVILAFAPSWYEAIVLLVIINVVGAIQWPGFIAFIAESASEESTGSAFGLFEFVAGLGYIAGPALGAWLINYVSYRHLFLGTALISAICGPLRLVLLKEPPKPPEAGRATSWKELLSGSFVPALVASVAISWLNNLTIWGPFIALHAKDWWGWSESEVNRAIAIGSIALSLVSLIAGKITDRYGDARVLIVGALLFPALMVILAYMKPSLLFWLIFLLLFAFSQIAWIAYSSFIAHQAPPEYRGSFLGIIGTVSGLLGSLSPGAGGILRREFGSSAPFWLALLCSIGLAISVLLRKEELDIIYTVGHSNRSLEEFIALLRSEKIKVVADVRRFPYSRLNPQFNRENLEKALKGAGIEYVWLGNELGGYRAGGYEEHTKSEEFQSGLEKLEFLAFHKRTALMCAEKQWFRCHRRFIADELIRRGWEVLHLVEPGTPPTHHKFKSQEKGSKN